MPRACDALAAAVSELVPAHRVAALQADLAAIEAGYAFVTSSGVTSGTAVEITPAAT